MESTVSAVGSDILSLITIGLYDDPLSVYREYVQNAADALEPVERRFRRVKIDIDRASARVTIRDDGPGLSYSDAVRSLIPIARSRKRGAAARGFRGIGRLVGLAFAETVIFRTRARRSATITRVEWDGVRLFDLIRSCEEPELAIGECVHVQAEPATTYPEHFFEVELRRVARHASGAILNPDLVEAYIAETCPVPMSAAFPFRSEFESLFSTHTAPLELDVSVDGRCPVTRMGDKTVIFPNGADNNHVEFERVRIPAADGQEVAAVGWVAHTSYLGAIPSGARIRGIRARIGNIQIGGENVFDRIFADDRFNRWCVGEVHVLDCRIVPNVRRDYFEPGPHLRNLENRLQEVFRGITQRCRRASVGRNRSRRILSDIANVEEVYELLLSGYLSANDGLTLVGRARDKVRRIINDIGDDMEDCSIVRGRIDDIRCRLDDFESGSGGDVYSGISASDVPIYQRIFGALASVASSPRAARELMDSVLSRHEGERAG